MSDTAYPHRIDRWVTSDLREHSTEVVAREHESMLSMVDRANALLRDGGSAADALGVIGRLHHYSAEDRDVLHMITTSAGLTISHWQCRDQPGYTARSIDVDGRWLVGGDAGSWSGYWCQHMSTRDLIGYARATAKAHGGKLPPVWRRP